MHESGITLAVVNARIATGNPKRAWAEAIAVRGGRIAAVGSTAEIRKIATVHTRVVDARGQLLAAPPAGALSARTLEYDEPASFVLFAPHVTTIPAASEIAAHAVLTVVDGRIISER